MAARGGRRTSRHVAVPSACGAGDATRVGGAPGTARQERAAVQAKCRAAETGQAEGGGRLLLAALRRCPRRDRKHRRKRRSAGSGCDSGGWTRDRCRGRTSGAAGARGLGAHAPIEIRDGPRERRVGPLVLVAHAPIEIREARAEIRVVRERTLGQVVRSHWSQSIPGPDVRRQLHNSAPGTQAPARACARNGTSCPISTHESRN